MIKLYLSQANQGHNPGPLGYNEKAGMDAIIHTLLQVLEKDDRFKAYHPVAGNRIDTAYENTQEANRIGVDYYIALHSNAGGVGARGTIGFYHSGSPKGKKMCSEIVQAVSKVSPGSDHGVVTMDGFIEIKYPDAPACLVELEAHDWKIGVEWLTGERKVIADALYRGICAGCGLKPLEKPTGVDYRPLKAEAIKVAKQLKIPCDQVDPKTRAKGPAFEQLLRDIAAK